MQQALGVVQRFAIWVARALPRGAKHFCDMLRQFFYMRGYNIVICPPLTWIMSKPAAATLFQPSPFAKTAWASKGHLL